MLARPRRFLTPRKFKHCWRVTVRSLTKETRQAIEKPTKTTFNWLTSFLRRLDLAHHHAAALYPRNDAGGLNGKAQIGPGRCRGCSVAHVRVSGRTRARLAFHRSD